MRVITIRRLDLQFDADQVTSGSKMEQAKAAVELINRILSLAPGGIDAKIFMHPDEIEVEIDQ